LFLLERYYYSIPFHKWQCHQWIHMYCWKVSTRSLRSNIILFRDGGEIVDTNIWRLFQ
jgi:hypothetical protein